MIAVPAIATWTARQLFDRLYRPVQDWLVRHAITYPWSVSDSKLSAEAPTGRESHPDSYAVWVSEVMLQQTRVETVRPYYQAWLERWPSLVALATANEDQVLRQWEGLGYYNRALNMLKCARSCVKEYKTQAEEAEKQKGWGQSGPVSLPTCYSKLLTLPGIGPYIAAAVASISGNEAVLALDTNVKRIFSRLYQQQPAPAVEKGWQQQHRGALQLCDWRGNANVALIQLGQQLCRSREPLCFCCPFREFCPASSTNAANWAKFPAPREYRKRKIQSRRLLLCLRESPESEPKYLMQRKHSGHLRHLWCFPELSRLAGMEVLATKIPGLETGQGLEYLGSFKHSYLDTQETVQVYCCHLSGAAFPPDALPQFSHKEQREETFDWLWADKLEDLTLPGPYRRFWQQLNARF